MPRGLNETPDPRALNWVGIHCPKCHGFVHAVPPTEGEVIYCPHCGSGIALAPRRGIHFTEKLTTIDTDAWQEAHPEPGAVHLSKDEARSQWMHDHPDYDLDKEEARPPEGQNIKEHVVTPPEEPSSGRARISWVICNACHAVIMHPNAKFCVNCGANLAKGASGETLLDLNEEAENCMVCKKVFREGDIALRCIHCGHLAHKAHLMEWVHAKGCCPNCGEKMDEATMQ